MSSPRINFLPLDPEQNNLRPPAPNSYLPSSSTVLSSSTSSTSLSSTQSSTQSSSQVRNHKISSPTPTLTLSLSRSTLPCCWSRRVLKCRKTVQETHTYLFPSVFPPKKNLHPEKPPHIHPHLTTQHINNVTLIRPPPGQGPPSGIQRLMNGAESHLGAGIAETAGNMLHKLHKFRPPHPPHRSIKRTPNLVTSLKMRM